MNFQQFMESHKANVERVGCSIIGVFATENSPGPNFAYSMGFAQFGFPDVIIVGNMPPEVAQALINNLLVEWKKSGGPTFGYTDEIANVPMYVGELTPQYKFYEEYTRQTVNFYEKYPEFFKFKAKVPPFAQIVWPDAKGVFPFESGNRYDPLMFQPILGKLSEHVS